MPDDEIPHTPSFNPRTGGINGYVADSPPAVVSRTVRVAAAAAPTVAGVSPATRLRWLYAVADAIEHHSSELVEVADAETALGLDRLRSEVSRAAAQLRFYADVAVEGSYLRATIDDAGESSPQLARTQHPLGPIAVFGASNFPFAFGVLGNDTASAIAAGCPVVVKAHPAHPLLSQRLAAVAVSSLDLAGAPPGTFGVVAGLRAGTQLVQSEEVRAVAFTGSQAGGLALWHLANQRKEAIPVFAEMGTVNPAVITPAAAPRMTNIAQRFVDSFTLGAGQFCTKPGLLLAPAGFDAANSVAAALRAAAPQPIMLTRDIATSVERGISELISAGAAAVELQSHVSAGWSAPAAVLSARLDALSAGSRLLEECFGPVALVIKYHDVAELLPALKTLQGALAASVITNGASDTDAPTIIGALSGKVGRVIVDGWPTGVAFTWAQQHGGPWPATTSPASTSVGAAALDRFLRPITYQSTPDDWLPPPLQKANPWGIPRRINGRLSPGRATER